MYCGTGEGVCQALFLGWQTDTDADADVYCINTIDIYKRGRGWVRERDFLSWLGSWTVGGVVQSQSYGILELRCRCKYWRYGVKVRWCGDTFHPSEKLTLYLKVTPFDSNTPTHLNQKVPIGGICFAASLPNSLTVSLLNIISL